MDAMPVFDCFLRAFLFGELLRLDLFTVRNQQQRPQHDSCMNTAIANYTVTDTFYYRHRKLALLSDTITTYVNHSILMALFRLKGKICDKIYLLFKLFQTDILFKTEYMSSEKMFGRANPEMVVLTLSKRLIKNIPPALFVLLESQKSFAPSSSFFLIRRL